MSGYTRILFFFPLLYTVLSADHKVILGNALDEVKRELDFYNANYSKMNVDDLFGLRLGQGQIIEAITECHQNPNCPDSLLTNLMSIESKLSDTCENAIPYVEQDDTDTYPRLQDMVDTPYFLPYQAIKFDTASLSSISIGTTTEYDITNGNACYSRILGSFEENNRFIPKCNITNSCWNMMNNQTAAGLYITHQLLYFITIEHAGCTKSVENFLKTRKIRDIQTQICSKVYKEAESLVLDGELTPFQQTLFFLQTSLCASLGYEDFFRSDWMEMTLRWADKTDGCFRMTLNQEDVSVQKIDSLANSLNLTKTEKQKDEKNTRMIMRKRIPDEYVKGSCMSPIFPLAFGIFSEYVRYLVRYM